MSVVLVGHVMVDFVSFKEVILLSAGILLCRLASFG